MVLKQKECRANEVAFCLCHLGPALLGGSQSEVESTYHLVGSAGT